MPGRRDLTKQSVPRDKLGRVWMDVGVFHMNVAVSRGEADDRTCVLMFSGGRDSTVAAVRLGKRFDRLTLVTVTSEHLTGIETVHQRLRELRLHLPPSTRWLHIIEPTGFSRHDHFSVPTCLPCHRSYTAIGLIIMGRVGARALAFGYTKYQSGWPEQTPAAIQRLTEVLAEKSLRLIVPVYDLASKEAAMNELMRYKLTPSALEQKCIKQLVSRSLDEETLDVELEAWELALRESTNELKNVELTIAAEATLSTLPERYEGVQQ